MGMLIDFYTGDTRKIIAALKRDDHDALSRSGAVAAHADLSFHLSPEDLDGLVGAACALLGRPAMTFAQAIRSDIMTAPAQDPETGIHEMSDAFTGLFAGLAPDQAVALYERWIAQMPEPPLPRRLSTFRRLLDSLRRGIGKAVLALALMPLLATAWVFSSRFRADRKQNKEKRAAAGTEPAASAEYTLRDGVASLAALCRIARERGEPVVYVWSL